MKFITIQSNTVIHVINTDHIIEVAQVGDAKSCYIHLSNNEKIHFNQPAASVLDLISRLN